MKRSDIVRTIQVQFRHMRASDAAAILDTVSDHMIEAIAAGDRIEVRGFGTFQPRARSLLSNNRSKRCFGVIINARPQRGHMYKLSL